MYHFAPVGVINRRHLQALPRYVVPDIELCPVADGEYPHVLASIDAGVVQVPQLGALILWIPLAEGVAERKDALLGARFFFVAPRPAYARVQAQLGNRVEQSHTLQR